jgi:CRP-like cAMP-binding protein
MVRQRTATEAGYEVDMDMRQAPVVGLLDYESSLIDGDADGRAVAAHALRARVLVLAPGLAQEADWGVPLESPAFGLLLLEGCLLREAPAGGRAALELLCPGDLLRPWEEPALLDERPARWRSLNRCTLAVLDGSFARRAAPWPQVAALLLSRLMRRSRHASLMLAIRTLPCVEDRVLAVLWILAERIGQVTMQGVVVKLPLRQADLGAMAGARRPTVNVTLKLLRERGTLREWTSHGFVLNQNAGSLVAECLARGGSAR